MGPNAIKKRQPGQEWRLGIFKVRWDGCLQGADNEISIISEDPLCTGASAKLP